MTKNKKLQATVNCPLCAGAIEIYKVTETISPAVPAEKETMWIAEKSTQTKLK